MTTGSAFDLAGRVAAGQFDHEVRAWLQRGYSTWVNAEGDISLEVAHRLPTTPAKFAAMQRDLHLAAAARILCEECGNASPADLLHELDTFITRGAWYAWRDRRDPPAGTSELRTALFYVARAIDGNVPSLKTIVRAVGQIFNKKCPAP